MSAEIERRVEELAREHSGQAFAGAVRAYWEQLDNRSREELQRILLDRAATFDVHAMDRVERRGWFRRQWDRAGGHKL